MLMTDKGMPNVTKVLIAGEYPIIKNLNDYEQIKKDAKTKETS